jgi:hypothetical protein
MTSGKRYVDLVASAFLIAVALWYARAMNFGGAPYEDAAMLMRYADHLGHGHGIVWNIGEPPVDGATDFLFMAAAAGLVKLGLTVEAAVRTLGFGAHFLTVLLIYWANRWIWNAGVIFSLFSAMYLAAGSGLTYVSAYFGTPCFALFATVTWVLCLWLIKTEKPTAQQSLLFALSGLVTGLIRPEGVILSSVMLIAIVIERGWRVAIRTAVVFAAVFAVLGGTYFFWRWHYFGHPLPNPYYKKGAGGLYWGSFWISLTVYSRFIRPFLLAVLLAARSARTTRLAIALMLPQILFAASFILISDDTNFAGRFQYALLPIMLVSWVPMVSGLGRNFDFGSLREKAAWVLAAAAFAFAMLRYSSAQSCDVLVSAQECGVGGADGRLTVAKVLSSYQDRGYVIATTEAGLLPLYSRWTAIDAWGLNDAWIAHNRGVTAEYLDRYKPQVIVFHAFFSPLLPKPSRGIQSEDWFKMTLLLRDYAIEHGYVLAGAFGDNPHDSHYYYVRSDFADSAQIVHDIAGTQYGWLGIGRRALNFATLARPEPAVGVMH